MGKEALDDDDKNDDRRDKRRRRRGDGETSAHPLLSLTPSPYSLFSLRISCEYNTKYLIMRNGERK